MFDVHKQSECHKLTYTKQIILVPANDFSQLKTICSHHKAIHFDRYELTQTSCCDPYKIHKTTVKKNLRRINLPLAQKGHTANLCLIPGKKVCVNCLKKLNNSIPFKKAIPAHPQITLLKLRSARDHLAADQISETLNCSLTEINRSPVKTHSLPPHMRATYGKRKLSKVNAEYQKRLSKVLKITEKEIVSTDSASTSQLPEITKDATAFNQLMVQLRLKLKQPQTTRAQKIQILTMVPMTWSRQEAMDYFEVSQYIQYMVRTARKLLQQHGILTIPLPRQGKTLDKNIPERIINFYCDNEFTRIMPGISDRISIRKNVHEQKRLILCTLKELHVAFREKYPEDKISFSKFCTLRPKWCVTAGCSGTHSVCICTIHQNVILLIDENRRNISGPHQALSL